MTIVDASVMVGVFYQKDQFHEVSKNWFAGHFRTGGMLTAPALLISEVAGVISRRTGRPKLGHLAIQRLQALPELTLIPMSDALIQSAAEIAADLGLGGADACYVALALRDGLPLATWDTQQRERSAQIIDARTPETLLGWSASTDDTVYDAIAEAVEQYLHQRYRYWQWNVERAAERRQACIRSQVPMDYSGLTILGNIPNAGVRQQVGVIGVDMYTALDEDFFVRVFTTIEHHIPGIATRDTEGSGPE